MWFKFLILHSVITISRSSYLGGPVAAKRESLKRVLGDGRVADGNAVLRLQEKWNRIAQYALSCGHMKHVDLEALKKDSKTLLKHEHTTKLHHLRQLSHPLEYTLLMEAVNATSFDFEPKPWQNQSPAEPDAIVKKCDPDTALRIISGLVVTFYDGKNAIGDIDAQDKNGVTALMIAISNSQTQMAKLLTDYGADVKKVGEIEGKRVTALSLAIANHLPKTIDLLLSKMEQVDWIDVQQAVESDNIPLLQRFFQGYGAKQFLKYMPPLQESQNRTCDFNRMEECALRAFRSLRFPADSHAYGRIDNKYKKKDQLEVFHTSANEWIVATVIDKENNWIVVHFDGWPEKYDQKIHVHKDESRLRTLTSKLANSSPDQAKLQNETGFKLVQVPEDGNCLYSCFASEIYGDSTLHSIVRQHSVFHMHENNEHFKHILSMSDQQFNQFLNEQLKDKQWGDYVDIDALTEYYNVKVRIYELEEVDGEQSIKVMNFPVDIDNPAIADLPLILLAKRNRGVYNLLRNPNEKHARPLGGSGKYVRRTSSGVETVQGLRIREQRLTKQFNDYWEKVFGDVRDAGYSAWLQTKDESFNTLSRIMCQHVQKELCLATAR